MIEIETSRAAWFLSTYDLSLEGGHACDVSGENAVVFSPSGSELTIGNDCGLIFLLDGLTGKVLSQIDHQERVLDMLFSQDGKYVLASSCGENEGITIWNMQALHATRFSNVAMTCTLTWSPKQPFPFVVVGPALRLVNLDTGEIIRFPFDSFNIAYSPDGDVMAAEVEEKLQLWDSRNDTILNWSDWQNYQSNVLSLSWSSENKLALLSADGVVVVWDMMHKEPIGKTTVSGPKDNIHSPLVFSPDGSQLAILEEGLVTIWLIPER